VNEFLRYYRENYQTAEEAERLRQVPAVTPVVAVSGIASIGREPVEQQHAEIPTGSEAQRYISMPLAKVRDSYNPLVLWKDLEEDFPTLAQMAKDILAIPAAGVGTERKFSEGRDVVTYRRSNLSPATIENLMVIRHHEKISATPAQRIRPATEADQADFRESEADDGGETSDEESDASDSDWDTIDPMTWVDDSDTEEFPF
jgi:hAT family C-terminal dimerisation region